MALARYFDACYPQVKAVHEPRPSRRLRIASNRYLCGRLTRNKLIRSFVKARARLFQSISEPVYIEANNFLHGFLDVFDDIFDDPRVLHIVRDPRTFIRSWINFGVFRGLKGLAGRYCPFWLLKPEKYEKAPVRRWARMPRPERIAWYWNAINAELDRGQGLFGDRYMRVRYEDLFEPDGRELLRLTEWIGLPGSPDLIGKAREGKVNASRDRGFPRWQDLLIETRRSVLACCRDRMTKYAYDVDV